MSLADAVVNLLVARRTDVVRRVAALGRTDVVSESDLDGDRRLDACGEVHAVEVRRPAFRRGTPRLRLILDETRPADPTTARAAKRKCIFMRALYRIGIPRGNYPSEGLYLLQACRTLQASRARA